MSHSNQLVGFPSPIGLDRIINESVLSDLVGLNKYVFMSSHKMSPTKGCGEKETLHALGKQEEETSKYKTKNDRGKGWMERK